MPDEPSVSLKEYIERIISDHELRHTHEEHARSTALTAVDERLRNMNEFRGQAADRDAAFLTKVEFEGYKTAAGAQTRWLVGLLVSVAGLGVAAFATLAAR